MRRPDIKMIRAYRDRVTKSKDSSLVYFRGQTVYKKNGGPMNKRDLHSMTDEEVLECVVRLLPEVENE